MMEQAERGVVAEVAAARTQTPQQHTIWVKMQNITAAKNVGEDANAAAAYNPGEDANAAATKEKAKITGDVPRSQTTKM